MKLRPPTLKAMLVAPLLLYQAAKCCGQDNYMRTYTFLDSTASVARSLQNTIYYDGMGREVLTVSGAPSMPDSFVASLTEYNDAGSVSHRWLPAPSDGDFVSTSAFKTTASDFYGIGEIPYTLYTYNYFNPLLLESENGPGIFWKGHQTLHTLHNCEPTGEYSCKKILVDNADGSLYIQGCYSPHALRVSETTDADGLRTLRFENRAKKIVLERRIACDTIADTRYVYDIRGDLRYTISPEGSALLPDEGDVPETVITAYAMRYDYDYRHRVIRSRLPGCGATEYVYDKYGALLMSADAVQRQSGIWTVTMYDRCQRPAVRGTATFAGCTPAALRRTFADSTLVVMPRLQENNLEGSLLYDWQSMPDGFTPYMAWYYDNYDFIIGANGAQKELFDSSSANYTAVGLCTGNGQIDMDGNIIYSAVKYDGRGNVVLRGEWDFALQDFRYTVSTSYNFMNQPTSELHKYEQMVERAVMDTHSALFTTEYDDLGRITCRKVSVDGGQPVTLTADSYDRIGRLAAQRRGIDVTFGYDIRSHLTSISSTVYSEQSEYAPTGGSADVSPSFKYINASTDTWHGTPAGQSPVSINWRYSYDGLGRLAQSLSADGLYGETCDIDLDANVCGIVRRYRGADVQNAVISFDESMPTEVHDVSSPYYGDGVGSFPAGDYLLSYDRKGRLEYDGTRRVTKITYGIWGDLPRKISMSNKDYSRNNYTPDGTLRERTFVTHRIKVVTVVNSKGDTVTRQRKADIIASHRYFGPFERIRTDSLDWRVHTPVGYYDIKHKKNYWYLTNRLGSVMAVVDGNGRVVQRTGIYPGGTPFVVDYTAASNDTVTDQNVIAPAADRLYAGNRWLAHSGLDWYDNTARMHDPLLMRFTTSDPFANLYPDLNPWTHCASNPANNIDPDGKVVYATEKCQEAVFNMLPDYEKKYISFDEKGKLSVSIQNISQKPSLTLEGLAYMANHDQTAIISYSDRIIYRNPETNEIVTEFFGEIRKDSGHFGYISDCNDLGTGEEGWYGSTIYPKESPIKRSLSGNFEIVINSTLSLDGASQAIGHEMLGHAYIYLSTGDYSLSTHKSIKKTLSNHIIKIVNEIIYNQNKNKNK